MGKGMRAGRKSGGKKAAAQEQMKQLAAMQQQMEVAQNRIADMTAEGTAGGSAVTVTVDGNRRLVDVKIQPDACDPEDVDMLQDLILAAANEALRTMEEMSEEEMSKVTGGLGLPPGLL